MNHSKIFITKKLEKIVREFVCEDVDSDSDSVLGDWSSTLFFVSNKKCWLLLNKATKYALILPDVKKGDLKNISTIFKKEFYEQLKYAGIKVRYELINKIIGDIRLCPTDNDKSAMGSINNNMRAIKIWKSQYKTFDNMPFRELNRRLNFLSNQLYVVK